jgi:hypothetical protein
MKHHEDGFLSKDVDEIRSIVHQLYPAWVSLFYSTNRSAVGIQHALNINPSEPTHLYATALYARTLSSIQAAIVVLERGMEPQARALLRMALETFFALAAIAKQPSIVQRLQQAHAAEQRRAAKYMAQWQAAELQKVAHQHFSTGTLDQFLRTKGKDVDVLELAKIGGYEDFYRTVYMVFSWSVHGATIDLERHLVKDARGNVIELRNEAEIENQVPSWSCAIELLIKSQEAIACIFTGLDVSNTKKAGDTLHGLLLTAHQS